MNRQTATRGIAQGSASVRQARGRRWVLGALLAFACSLSLASSASALTYGVGWTGYGEASSEMELVKRSGASLFRIPIDRANCWHENWSFCDQFVKAGWEKGITIEPYLVWFRNG